MARIVLIHGVGHQFGGEQVLLRDWTPSLQSGVELAGCSIEATAIAAASYGDLFRPPGVKSAGLPPYTAADLEPAIYEELLVQMWDAAVLAEPDSIQPRTATNETKGQVWNGVQQALNRCCEPRFFSGVAERMLILDLKQAYRYLTEPDVRQQALQRVAAKIGNDTRIIVAHSLGTVVGYEALCANPDWPVHTLVTLGSPLGIRNFFFDRLKPPPGAAGIGGWPGPIRKWTNIADQPDLAALEKRLATRFGNEVHDVLVNNGARFHDAQRYLTARETGAAIAEGLLRG